jgi:uncharacterized membrane protein YdjX (TVP38/TMEM64 family)
MEALDLALVAAAVFGVNLLPAFAPPTWAVLVFARLHTDLPLAALVVTGALAAASGRLVLALTVRALRDRLSPERVANLEAARALLVAGRGRSAAGLGLFLLSPVPSAQLFVAAGLVRAPLRPLVAAFLAGRLVSYSIYVGAASAAEDTIGSVIDRAFGSPLGIALQVAMLALLVGLYRVDWARLISRRESRPDRDEAPRAGAP